MATVSEAEAPQPRKVVFDLPTADGTSQATVTLQENEDATKPPLLLDITKRALDPPDSTNTPLIQRETHVIISLGSGARQAENFFNSVVKPILTAIHGEDGVAKIKVHTTTSATSISDYTSNILFPSANNGTPLRIILLSGDGGIVDLVNGLLSPPQSTTYASPQVVLLPLGTANALYHSINTKQQQPSNWGLAALASPHSAPLPVFTATFSPGARLLVDEARAEEALPKNEKGEGLLHGAVVASWGMHASLVADSDTAHYRQYGVERFQMAAKEALYPADGGPPHAYKARISRLLPSPQNGEEKWVELETTEHMYVLATLVSHLERPFCISPASAPLDGSVRLVHFGPKSADEAMRIMGLAYQGGKHVHDAAVRYESIDGLRIRFEGLEKDARWRRICVDGKIVRVDEDGWVEVRKDQGKRALDVVVVAAT
ncbi:ATP-NAD kinase-like domain-containing protein [Bipolaris maydis]|nr:ATP-NAD kinase-like domain-containing protein [Bipolaris maydis]